MKKRTTIHDLAKQLSLDSSTVSRALRGSPLVKQKTKDIVNDLAIKLNYKPNRLASNLRSNKSNTIGVIVPRISRHFFSSAISGIEEEAYKKGYNILICQSQDKFKYESKNIDNLLHNRVDGLIISLSLETRDLSHFSELFESETPIVFFDRVPMNALEYRPIIKIVNDDEAISYNATTHLINQGCERIAYHSGPDSISIYNARLKGYYKALKKASIPILKNMIFYSNLMLKDGVDFARKILELKKLPDAIYSANDTTALSSMQYLKSQGIRIPQDIKMIGFSDEPASAMSDPTLTTVDQSGVEMGKVAVKKITDLIENREEMQLQSNQIITMNSTLIIRESSR